MLTVSQQLLVVELMIDVHSLMCDDDDDDDGDDGDDDVGPGEVGST